MSEKDNGKSGSRKVNRRSILQAVGAGSVISVAGVEGGSASEARQEIRNKERVERLIDGAGNPNITDMRTKTLRVEDGYTLEKTEIATEVGTLVYAEPAENVSKKFDDVDPQAYFEFGEVKDELKSQIPTQYRAPSEHGDLVLVYDEGQIVARRTATPEERRVLASTTDVDIDSIDESLAIYDESTGSFELLGEVDGEKKVYQIELEDKFEVANDEGTVDSLESEQFKIEVITGDEVSTQEWDCGSCWGGISTPCTSCVAAGSVCAGCAVVCGATSGIGCIPCIAGCATGGGACGCCLSCDSGVSNPVCC